MQDDLPWLQSLRATGDAQASAVRTLRALLVRALASALRHRPEVDASLVEDFAQDALIHILRRLDHFEGRSKFTTWAIAIAIDTAMSQLRRKHWQNLSLDALMEQGAELAPLLHSTDEPPDTEDQRRLLSLLRDSISHHLTDRQRAAIAGQLQGLSVEELSTTLRLTPGGLYKLIHDARRALKKHLLASGITAEQIRTTFAP